MSVSVGICVPRVNVSRREGKIFEFASSHKSTIAMEGIPVWTRRINHKPTSVCSSERCEVMGSVQI